jgi:signal transduction histidine kinase
VSSGVRIAVGGGVVCALVLLLSPAFAPDADAVLPAVLPLGFFAAGVTAQALRPGHRVGDRLLAVGVLHLAALVGAVLGSGTGQPAVALGVAETSAVLFALGFVALFDLLARYPTGGYAGSGLGRLVAVLGVAATGIATLALLGSPRIPSVLELDGLLNPLHVPALEWSSGLLAAVALLPVAGLLLLVLRLRGASAADRAQMRWPLATTAVVAVGLLTSVAVEQALGAAAQTALFVAAGTALPASFLVGLLRHTEEAERLAAVEASRARLGAVADAERRRLERNLHDGAQQQILALMAQVELTRTELGGRDADVDRGLRSIGEGLRSVHAELRELAQGLYPSVLTDRGLAEAVRSAMTRLPRPGELRVEGAVDGRRYAEPVEGAAYFLVLEGLANAMKHAGGATTAVSLAEVGDRLEVVVRDDGSGFDAAAPSAGSGLQGLADRVAAAGGRLVVDTGPGAGTVLRGILPASGRG